MCADELLVQEMGSKRKVYKTLYPLYKFVYFLPPLLILSEAFVIKNPSTWYFISRFIMRYSVFLAALLDTKPKFLHGIF